MNTQPATAVKGVTWTELVTGIKAGSEERFPYSKSSYIRELISRNVKLKYPEREFTTEKAGEELIVKRLK